MAGLLTRRAPHNSTWSWAASPSDTWPCARRLARPTRSAHVARLPGWVLLRPAYRFDYAEFAAHSDKDVDFIDTLIDTINASKPVDKVFLAGYRAVHMAYYYHCVRAHRLAAWWPSPTSGLTPCWMGLLCHLDHTNEMGGVAGPTPVKPPCVSQNQSLSGWRRVRKTDRGNQRASWDVYAKRVMGCTGEPFTAWSSPLSTLQTSGHSVPTAQRCRARSEHATVSTSNNPLAAMELGQLCTQQNLWVVVLQRSVQSPHPPQPPPTPNPPPWTTQGLLCYRRHRTLRSRHIHRSHPLMG